jgi:hypothetical protein
MHIHLRHHYGINLLRHLKNDKQQSFIIVKVLNLGGYMGLALSFELI